jgi:hypothetical protein
MRAERARAVIAALGFSIAALCATPALADKRVALVVGNSAYVNVPRLANPANDAKLMAATLRALGFVLVGGSAQLDLDKAHFDSAVQNFGNQLPGADVALFYYAGHGMQVRGSNYLVPIGANPTKEADFDFQMLDAALVLRQMESAGTKLNLVVLDACRNNPFGGRGLRSTDSGLAHMRAPEGTLISFATQPDSVAQDGVGSNSPYTNALAQTIRQPGLGIFEVFNEVGLAVMQATGDAQRPWVSSSPIRGSFFFAGPSAVAAPSIVPPGPAADEIAWGFVKNTTDLSALRQFLSQFSASPHKAEAEARIASLERAVRDQPRPQRPDQVDIGAQIDAMVGDPPPLPDPSEVFAVRPASPLQRPSDDIGKRIDEMVALAPMTDEAVQVEPRPSGRRSATGRPVLDFGAPVATPADPARTVDTTPNFAPADAVSNRKVKRDVALGYLDLRKGPGQNYQLVTRIPAGANGVTVTGACASSKELSAFPYCQVLWYRYQGWVASSGLE